MSVVYAFAATKMEGDSVGRLVTRLDDDVTNVSGGRIGMNDVFLFITGIGPKSAKAIASTVLRSPTATTKSGSTVERPDGVLILGTCGSLSSFLAEDEVIVYRQCLATDNNSAQARCTAPLTEHIISILKSKGINPRLAVGISSPRIAVTKQEKLTLARSGAEVVDMESFEIIVAANQARLPVAVIRVVSDSLERKIPDLNLALLENGEIDTLKALTVAIGSPIRTARVLAASKRALKKLSEVLEIVLNSDAYAMLPSETTSR
jgi:nucleoside phosphorylase